MGAWKHSLARYGTALICTAAAVAIRWLLQPVLVDGAPFFTFYIAVFALAYWAGAGPAALATVLGMLAADYFFIPPLYSLSFYLHDEHDTISVGLYALDCAVGILVIRALARAKSGAEQTRNALRTEIEAHLAAGRERDRLLKLVDMEHDAIIIADPDCRITGWSSGAEAMYGWTAAEAAGRPLQLLFRTDPAAAAAIDAAVCATGRWEGEVVHQRKDGTEIEVETREVLTRDAKGSPEKILKIDHDITARKRAEQDVRVKQKLEGIAFLAGGLAHDINNLMTVVSGNCSLALESALDEETEAQLTSALRASERVSELTRQLTAFSGKGVVLSENVDINKLLAPCRDLFGAALPERCELQLRLAGAVPPVRGDGVLLRQAVKNIVVNAAEAAAEGASALVTISTGTERLQGARVDVGEKLPDGDYVYISVSDNGVGIDPEVRARIFDPFFSTKFLGRGLGLAAAAGIVRSHGGGIGVETAAGAGSTFKIFLPVSGS